jgi:hypothetical protein
MYSSSQEGRVQKHDDARYGCESNVKYEDEKLRGVMRPLLDGRYKSVQSISRLEDVLLQWRARLFPLLLTVQTCC